MGGAPLSLPWDLTASVPTAFRFVAATPNQAEKALIYIGFYQYRTAAVRRTARALPPSFANDGG
jgi:hypothetical protein